MKCDLCARDNLSQRELEMHKKVFHKEPITTGQPTMSGVCPDCGASLWNEGGCTYCHSCGYSKC